MKHLTITDCPKCGKEHELVFDFYRPNHLDQDRIGTNCSCGATFETISEAQVNIEFITYQSELI